MDDNLQKAPIVESIFELRWSPRVAAMSQGIPVRVHAYDLSVFPFDLARQIIGGGYSFTEQIVPEFVPPGLHQVRTRFRRKESAWPCIQIGDGIITVNQINDGYSWQTFKADILDVLEQFLAARKIDEPLVDPMLSLRYIDGVSTEDVASFLASETRLDVGVPAELVTGVGSLASLDCRTVSYEGGLTSPEKAGISLSVESGNVNGQQGVILRYDVVGPLGLDSLSRDDVESWLEPAHDASYALFRNTFTDERFRRFA